MSNEVIAPNWKDYEKFVAQMSWKSYRRARASGLQLEFDDIFQEASVAYMRASKTFNPALGYRFITYLGAAVMTALANYKHRQDRQLVGRTVSLDSMLEDDGDGYEIFPGSEPSPLDELCVVDGLQEAMRDLGPLGAQMVEWMIDPPPEIEAELEALRWKFAEMTRRGIRRNVVTLDMDVRFLLGELLPKLIPENQAAVRRLRSKVQGVVSAWQI